MSLQISLITTIKPIKSSQTNLHLDPSRTTTRNNSAASFKSAGFEVEIASSTECPSQRTVFVKCGAFECGQDSFSLPGRLEAEGSQISANLTARRQPAGGAIINDFPWLVSGGVVSSN